jgi:hypothetical protein
LKFLSQFMAILIFAQTSIASAKAIDCEIKHEEYKTLNEHILRLQKDYEKNYDNFYNAANTERVLNLIEASSKDAENFPTPQDLKNFVEGVIMENVTIRSLGFYIPECANENRGASCINAIISITTEPEKFKTKTELVSKDKDTNYKKVASIQQKEEFYAYKYLMKAISLDLLNNKKECKLEDETSYDYKNYYEAACASKMDGLSALDPNDPIHALVDDNLNILNELNLKLHAYDDDKLKEACDVLIENNFKEQLSNCVAVNEKLAKEKKKIDQEVARKEKGKGKVEKGIENVSKIVKHDDKREQRVKTNAPRKKSKFWRNTGYVLAGVGIAGAVGFGLHYAFKNVGPNSYTPPVYTETPRTYYNYSMNPYEMYKYQQYMMGGYMSSPQYNNWIGQIPDASNSPYSFEFSP